MSNHDWYNNKNWSEEIESVFRAKLKRARLKQEYLYYQAERLVQNHPDVALGLLEEYFSSGEHFLMAAAFLAQAKAYAALNESSKAANSFLAALAREKSFPQLQTEARLKFCLYVADHELVNYFHKCNELLSEPGRQCLFPIESFRYHAAMALMLHNRAEVQAAKQSAQLALDAANIRDSGLGHGRIEVGLVGESYVNIREKLASILTA